MRYVFSNGYATKKLKDKAIIILYVHSYVVLSNSFKWRYVQWLSVNL